MRRIRTLLFLLFFCTFASAQYTAGKITFSDRGVYSQQELETAAGMHSGQVFATADLSTAAQRLSDTACFDNVEVTLNGPTKAITVLFKITPAAQSQMLRASFQNIVWLTPDELTAAIHANVPLFHGSLPEAGNQIEAVTSALQQALTAHGVTATIASSVVEPSTGHPDRIIAFVAHNHPVVVGSVDLKGISPQMQVAMQKQSAALTGRPYNEGLAGLTTIAALLAPYRDAGYVGATISGYTRTAADTSDRTQVAITGTLEEGSIYRVSSVSFSETPIESSADFAKTLTLHPEDVASGKALHDTLAPVEAAYRNKGFMDVVVDADPTLDNATHHVAYKVTAIPGEQYHLRAVLALGLDPAARSDFDHGWLMKPGDVYSPGYVATFITKNTALRALAPYTASFKAIADPQTHLVDLTITFIRSGNRP